MRETEMGKAGANPGCMPTATEAAVGPASVAAADGAGGGQGVSRPRPIRVLHVLSRLDRGGAELATVELMRRSDPGRFRFDVCTLSGRAGGLAGQLGQLGVAVYPLAVRRLDFSSRFRRLLRSKRFDVVHCHVHHASGFILRLAGQAGVPGRIAFFHNSHDGRPNNWLRRAYRAWMRRAIRRHATSVLAGSRATMASVWGRDWDQGPRFEVLYLGVEPPNGDCRDRQGVADEFGLPATAPLYVHVGRMTEQKNHFRLVSVIAALRKRQPAARLLVVGAGEPEVERRVRSAIRRLGLDGAVVLCGERTDVFRLVASADVMIFPSLWEGQGLAALEACAVGTPVVASDLPCLTEMAAYLDGIHCLGLDREDDQWARLILRVAEQYKRPHKRRAAARRLLESPFHLQRAVEAANRLWAEAARSQWRGGDG
ncbi:MAG TPA: glycosyltransferase [Planctomycetaceae bacterium]|nr:glycosyltransferase [Planctomycetaceae bacterium]